MAFVVTGCDSTGGVVGGVVGATLLGAQSPGQEIEQVYYLGVFDPQGQVDPMFYRVRVHGQASAISGMRFSSGWVPANTVDALQSNFSHSFEDGPTKGVQISKAEGFEGFPTGRRLVLVGPEGFREAPRDHRLVVVMGSTPDKWFGAIDQSLGTIAEVQREQFNNAIATEMLRQLNALKDERLALQGLADPVSPPATASTTNAAGSSAKGGE